MRVGSCTWNNTAASRGHTTWCIHKVVRTQHRAYKKTFVATARVVFIEEGCGGFASALSVPSRSLERVSVHKQVGAYPRRCTHKALSSHCKSHVIDGGCGDRPRMERSKLLRGKGWQVHEGHRHGWRCIHNIVHTQRGRYTRPCTHNAVHSHRKSHVIEGGMQLAPASSVASCCR